MKKIEDILGKTQIKKEKTTGGVNSRRSAIVEQLCVFMGDDPKSKRMGYWLGRTKKIDPDRIYQLMRQAKEGKNPQALFNWLLKKELKGE